MKHGRAGSIGLGLVLLAGCAGSDGTALPSRAPDAAGGDGARPIKATARFTIRIPKKPRKPHGVRPRYISSATKSMTVTVVPAGGHAPVIDKTVNLTPSSQGCSPGSNGTTCTFSIAVVPGRYTISVSTFDGLSAAGNVLSSAQQVPITVLAGKANTIALTLSGVPAALSAGGTTSLVRPTAGGLRIYGAAQAPLALDAQDADGETIVGAGAPTFTATLTAATGWSAAAGSIDAGGTLAVTPPGTNASTAQLHLQAHYADDTCALATAVCTATITLENDVQTLFAIDAAKAQIDGFTPPTASSAGLQISTVLAGDLSTSQPIGVAIDGSANLFVLDGALDRVIEITPPYTGTPAGVVSTTASHSPLSIAVSSSGFIAVSTTPDHSTGDVTVYAPPYNGPGTIVKLPANALPSGLAFDANGDLFVATCACSGLGADNVLEYAAPYNSMTPELTISGSVVDPTAMTFDASGDLFVANTNMEGAPGTGSVTEYATPFTSSNPAPAATLTGGVMYPMGIGLDASGNLFVANPSSVWTGSGSSGNGSIVYFAAPYTGLPVTVANAATNPYSAALDAAGNLYAMSLRYPLSGDVSQLNQYGSPYGGVPVSSYPAFAAQTPVAITP